MYGSTMVVPLSIHLLPFIEQLPLAEQLMTNNAGANLQPITAVQETQAIPAYSAPLDFTTSDWQRTQNFACNLHSLFGRRGQLHL